MKNYFFISLALTLTGCAQVTPKTNVERDEAVNPFDTDTIAVYQMNPPRNSMDVDLDAPIVLTYNGPIGMNGLEDWQIRVQDDFNNTYWTEKTFNPNNNEITIRRKINNQYISWDIGAHLNITAEYLLGADDGQKIWPYTASVWTKGLAESPDGSFKILDTMPSEYIIHPSNFIEIKFSKAVYPGVAVAPNTNTWANSFQFYVFQTKTENGNYMGVTPINDPPVQLAVSSAGVADKMFIRPANGWPAPSSPLYPVGLLICVLSTNELRASQGGQPLQQGNQGVFSPCPSANKMIERIIIP